MGERRKTLLSVIELLGYPNQRHLYERLGYQVITEFSVRGAIRRLRTSPPDVVVADFYFQSDFRDRLSNLESLLAAVQKSPATRVLVLYENRHQDALDAVRRRLRVDAALTLPVQEPALEAQLRAWL